MIKLNIDLPDGFYKEEIRSDFTVTKKMKEVWAVELDLLNEFQKVCKLHDLKYYADAGTLLGAIRHNGFIPWDDDIDVVMFRDEYEKLLTYADDFKDPYFLQSFQTEKEMYYSGHAQLRNSNTTAILSSSKPNKHKFNQGIFIDIFVLDAVPDDINEYNKEINTIKKYNKLLNIKMYYADYNLVKRIIKTIIKPFINSDNVYNKKEALLKKYKVEDNEMVSELSIDAVSKELIRDKHYYDSVVDIEFENTKISCPVSYHFLLRKCYGDDYMTPKKVSTFHGNVLLDANKTYKDYLKLNDTD